MRTLGKQWVVTKWGARLVTRMLIIRVMRFCVLEEIFEGKAKANL
jgi:hypothetical protein